VSNTQAASDRGVRGKPGGGEPGLYGPVGDRIDAAHFRDGPIEGLIWRKLAPWKDDRGWLIELYREDELPAEFHPQMCYVSMTLPGVSRGPHEHIEQADYFAFVGPGEFELHLWDARPASPTRGVRQTARVGQSNPMAVVIPPGVVHAYRNVGEVPAWVMNLPNRLYKGPGRKEPVDEIRHEDAAGSPYVLR
jgi:dTDP-4-dehydrorhamnose 3,5-epimerase